jgi:tetratricopeptide (TPR) repeat protein
VLNSAPQDIVDTTRLAANYRTIGSLLMKMGDLSGARENAREALQIMQPMAAAQRDDPRVLRELASDFIALGDAEGNDSGYGSTEKPTLELQHHQNALELNRRWALLQPTELLPQQGIAYLDGRIASDLAQCGKPVEGIEYGRQALKILEKLTSGSDATPNAWLENQLASTHSHLGDAILLSGNPRAAVTEYRAELAKLKYLAQQDPRDAQSQIQLGSSWLDLGKALVSSGRARAGLQHLSKGVEIEERQLASDPKRSEIASILGAGYVFQGEALEKMGDEPSALRAYAKASRLFESPTVFKADDLVASLQVAAARAKVAAALTKLDRLDQARDRYQEALQLIESAATAKPPNLQAQYILADVYAGLGDLVSKRPRADSAPKEACSWYRKSLDLWQQLPLRTGMAPNRFDLLAPESVAQRLASCNEASAIAGY